MAGAQTFESHGWINTNATVRAYVLDDQSGQPLLPGAVSALSYTVTESLGPNQGEVFAAAVALSPVSTYILSSLSTTGWQLDLVGYNFQATIPATCFPDAGDYVIDIVGTLAADNSTFPLAKIYHHAKSRS